MNKIVKLIALDNLRGRVVILYFLILAVMSFTSLMLQDNASKATLTVLNIMLFIVPLMSLCYPVIYLYNSHEFLVMMLSQPLKRSRLWSSFYLGVSGGLLSAFLLGTGLPALIFLPPHLSIMLVIAGTAITLTFVSLAFLITMFTSDKARGIGAALLLWLCLTMIWDSLCLYGMFLLEDWPVEKPVMALLMLNPLDLARFQVILQTDAAAMMGYSGAAFKEFLGATGGIIVSTMLMMVWIFLPFGWSSKKFSKKDL